MCLIIILYLLERNVYINVLFSKIVYSIVLILFHLFKQSCQSFEIASIYLQVQQIAVAVEEFVGGEGMDVEVVLDGGLLVAGQVDKLANYVHSDSARWHSAGL